MHIAAYMGRLDIVKHVLLQDSGSINQGFGAHKDTILHSAVRGNHTDVITYLVQENPCVEQSVTDIFGLTPLQCAIKEDLDTANMLYVALCPKHKSAMSAYDLLCDLITSINHRSMDQLFDIAAKMLVDRHLDWSRPNRSPYLAALTLYTQMCNWLEILPQRGNIPSDAIARHEKGRDTAIKLLHNLNNNFVPLRHYDDHGSTAILLLFESAPVDVLEAVYNALPERRKQPERGEVLTCSSVDIDGDSALVVGRVAPAKMRWVG